MLSALAIRSDISTILATIPIAFLGQNCPCIAHICTIHLHTKKEEMKKETREDIKIWSAIMMLLASVGFGIAGFCVSPVGELSESVLWLIAQFLMYAAMALGVDAYVSLAVRKYISKGGNNGE